MTFLRALVLPSMALLCAARLATGQLVRGAVTESGAGKPLRGATVLLEEKDRAVATARTDSLGAFSFRAPGVGPYRVRVRFLGFEPALTPAFSVAAGAQQEIRVALKRAAYALDTVRSEDMVSFFKVTSGESWFKKHQTEGKGLFLTGMEVLKSGRSACDYFANLPGMQFGVWNGYGASGGTGIASWGIPCLDKRVVTRPTADRCIAAMVDRWGYVIIIDSLDLHVRPRRMGVRADSVIVPLENVFGIEIYRNHAELPKDDAIPFDVRAGNTRCMWIQIWTHIAW